MKTASAIQGHNNLHQSASNYSYQHSSTSPLNQPTHQLSTVNLQPSAIISNLNLNLIIFIISSYIRQLNTTNSNFTFLPL